MQSGSEAAEAGKRRAGEAEAGVGAPGWGRGKRGKGADRASHDEHH